MTFKELSDQLLINEYKMLCDLAEGDEELEIRRAMCAVEMSMIGLEEHLTPEDREKLSKSENSEY